MPGRSNRTAPLPGRAAPAVTDADIAWIWLCAIARLRSMPVRRPSPPAREPARAAGPRSYCLLTFSRTGVARSSRLVPACTSPIAHDSARDVLPVLRSTTADQDTPRPVDRQLTQSSLPVSPPPDGLLRQLPKRPGPATGTASIMTARTYTCATTNRGGSLVRRWSCGWTGCRNAPRRWSARAAGQAASRVRSATARSH
jgi:hypothetical protein